MKIGVDLDSVLGDITTSLHEYHNSQYGTSYAIEVYDEFDLTKVWNVDEVEVMKRIFGFYESSKLEEIKPIPGSQKAIKAIAQSHSLYLITSRPQQFHHKTQNWIRNNFPGMFTDVLCTNQFSAKGSKQTTKSRICQLIGAKIMIDDHLDFALDCAECDINVLLYDQPWNRKKKLHKNIKRMHSWDEIEKYLNTEK